MDAIEVKVLEWFEDMVDTFQGLLTACARFQVDNDIWKGYVEKWGPDSAFIAKAYLEAFEARRKARKDHDFAMYCKATYTLSRDWNAVRRSVPWLDWGDSFFLGDDALQAATVIVYGLDRVAHDALFRAVDVYTHGNGKACLERAVAQEVLTRDDDGNWIPGEFRMHCSK